MAGFEERDGETFEPLLILRILWPGPGPARHNQRNGESHGGHPGLDRSSTLQSVIRLAGG
jgi:hypothetical protein